MKAQPQTLSRTPNQVQAASKRHPRAAVKSLISPLLGDPDIGSAQVEVINRFVKEGLPASIHADFLSVILNPQPSEASGLARQAQPLGPSQVSVLYALILLKPQLTQEDLGLIVQVDPFTSWPKG
mmetsp:Transcript_19210/g.30000  ORF Transcript_19210/g.30000 Transcript_19210/m.30000 type:complete len:125 (-) Transcript_19210:422-796(-)